MFMHKQENSASPLVNLQKTGSVIFCVSIFSIIDSILLQFHQNAYGLK